MDENKLATQSLMERTWDDLLRQALLFLIKEPPHGSLFSEFEEWTQQYNLAADGESTRCYRAMGEREPGWQDRVFFGAVSVMINKLVDYRKVIEDMQNGCPTVSLAIARQKRDDAENDVVAVVFACESLRDCPLINSGECPLIDKIYADDWCENLFQQIYRLDLRFSLDEECNRKFVEKWALEVRAGPPEFSRDF